LREDAVSEPTAVILRVTGEDADDLS